MTVERISLELDSLPLDLIRRVNLLVDRFEAELRAGSEPSAEAFLAELDDPRARLVLLRLLLLTEQELGARWRLTEFGGQAQGPRDGFDAGTTALGAEAVPEADRIIPGYEVIRELGRGGMGVVYLARQASLNRLVALKVIHHGTGDGPELRERFRREAELFARCRHPNLARIHHVGEHSGRPYLVLEYAEGGSLDKLLDGTPWSPQRAASLVEPLARAVAEVQGVGIVHRDLKPANILLDAASTPMVGDFGLAKLVGQDVRLTTSGVVLGTPSYMSPEQAEGRSGNVGPPTDVYALGAILFELLTGRPPFKGESAVETLRQVREVEVVAPTRLQPEIPRDLETICLTCLAKEPNRRYRGASELAEDLGRFLDGRTILARRARPSERLGRWCRRNPWVAATIVLLVGGLGFVSFLLWKADRAEHAASLAAAKAVTEAETSRSVLDFFLKDVIGQATAGGQAGPGSKHDPDLKVRTALDRVAGRLQQQFSGKPKIEAAIRRTIGESYLSLGLYAEAQPQVERALSLYRRELGPLDPETLEASRIQAQVFLDQDRISKAERLIRENLQGSRLVRGDEDVESLKLEHDLSVLCIVEEKFDEAEQLLDHALAGLRRQLGTGHDSTLAALQTLIELQIRRKKPDEAERNCLELVRARVASLGEEHPATLIAKQDLAAAYAALNKHELAETTFVKVVEFYKRVLGPKHPATIDATNNLAAFYYERDTAKAAGLMLEVLTNAEEVFGKDHSTTLLALNNLGMAYVAQKRYAEADPLFQRLLATRRRLVNWNRPDTVSALIMAVDDLTNLRIMQNDLDAAEPLLQEELDLRRRGRGESHAETVQARDNLGKYYLARGDSARAEGLFKEAAKSRRLDPKGDRASMASTLEFLAEAQYRQQKHREAERTLLECLGLRDEGTWARSFLRAKLGGVLLGLKRYAEAGPELLQGYEGMTGAKDAPENANVHRLKVVEWLIELHEATGNRVEADRWKARRAEVSPPR